MTLASLQKLIYDWIDLLKSANITEIIWANENAPRPIKPYLVLHIINSGKTGKDEAYTDENLIETRKLDNTYDISLQCVGGDVGELTEIMNNIESQTSLEYLYSTGISVNNIGEVTDISTAIDDKIERLSNLDLTIGIRTDIVNTGLIIEKVHGTGDIGNVTNNINVEK